MLDALGNVFPFLNKTAQSVRNIVRQPCSTEGGIGCQPPCGKLSHIQFHILFEGEKHTGQPVMPEGVGFFEASALFENASLGEKLIDAIHPFLWVAAAALKNQAFLIFHTAELFLGNLPYTHNFISSILMPCSWAISCWVSFRKLSTPGISERLRPLSQVTPT